MRSLAVACAALLPLLAAAQGGVPVPQSHIPPPVVLEMRALERQFDQALAQDCAPERCFSKGCVYRDHAAVDMPRAGSLPGLGTSEGPGSVAPQEYLTQARCEFTHEKSVEPRDVQVLARRLEQRLSKGWLKVSVGRQTLEPLPQSLRDAPAAEPAQAPPPASPAAAPAPPPAWGPAVAGRELWLSLLPHFSWMIALVLATLAALSLIWALRRLGRESLEEKAMLAQLAAAPPEPAPGTPPAPSTVSDSAAASEEERAFVAAQQGQWSERISRAELANDESGILDLLREWLRAGEFDLLAKALFLFGDRLSLAFSSDGALAVRKVEFADYLRDLDEKRLPSDAEFFRKLNHHAISASLMSQADVELYRSLREGFGPSGVARLVESLPARQGALLFALVPADTQPEVARIIPPVSRLQVAAELLASNRISPEETEGLFELLTAARSGKPLPPPRAAQGITDRGRTFDAAGALSVMLPLIDPDDRRALFAHEQERAGGTLPRWHEDILYGDMLLKLPEEPQRDLLLEVDVRNLAAWCSLQEPAWQARFIPSLAPSLQTALRASMGFSSRAEQLKLARAGQAELVAAMKRQVGLRRLSFVDLVS